MPRSPAMITAAFSPMAIAVLYVLAPTFDGMILRSKRVHVSLYVEIGENAFSHTGNLQTKNTVYIQPRVDDPTFL